MHERTADLTFLFILACCLLPTQQTCAIGNQYKILEGSVPADYIAYVRADMDHDNSISFMSNCLTPQADWYVSNRFVFSQYTCAVDTLMSVNSFTIDRSGMFADVASPDKAKLDAYMHTMYNTFEGCAISLQFLPDVLTSTLKIKFNSHTIKSHMDEQNLQVTEFFSVSSFTKTVSTNNVDIMQDTHGVPCSSGILHYITALRKFVYFQRDQDNTFYWTLLNFPLDATSATDSACNTNFVASPTVSTSRYQITLPSVSRSTCSAESIIDVFPETATVYGKFIYYFVKIK